jgi:hypothetical protein
VAIRGNCLFSELSAAWAVRRDRLAATEWAHITNVLATFVTEVACWLAIALPFHSLVGTAYIGNDPVDGVLFIPIIIVLILCFVILMLVAAGFVAGANGSKPLGAVGVIVGCALGGWQVSGTLLGALGAVVLLAAVAALIVPRLLVPAYSPEPDDAE